MSYIRPTSEKAFKIKDLGGGPPNPLIYRGNFRGGLARFLRQNYTRKPGASQIKCFYRVIKTFDWTVVGVCDRYDNGKSWMAAKSLQIFTQKTLDAVAQCEYTLFIG